MARDRDNDDYDDRDEELDRPRRRSDRDDDDYDDDRSALRGDARRGRDRVRLPGLLLAIASAIALAVAVFVTALSVISPAAMAAPMFDDFLIPMEEKKPPSPERDQNLRQLKQQRAEAEKVSPLSVAIYASSVVLSALALLGGLQLRGAKGYGLAMTGTICALIPCQVTGCCLLTMPFGIWALIVLLDQDVKAAFQSPRVRG